MKSVFSTLIIFLFSMGILAQSPQFLNYQAVVRNGNNEVVSNSTIGLRIQILQQSEFGAAVYVETHAPESNGNGVISLKIGTGTVVNGNFAAIDWSDGPYFLKTEIDPQGGTSYSITSTAQMVSVPYALYAQKAAEVEKIPSAFNVVGMTFQNLPADEGTTIDFTDGNGLAGTFIENNVYSLDDDEYTAPADGSYFFEAFVTIDTRSNPPADFYIYYSVNGSSRARLRNYTFMNGYTKVSLNTTLQLQTGDKVSLGVKPTENGTITMGANAFGTVRMTGFKIN
ncbi:hypothetical protein SAMN06265379_104110 [Saccharicrinis carchari]|uniref:C1q domain-containing protein n=1 Tax=Saccharicrinis carchari TaxID=1168039 RepID=A0A521D1E1_SACCC|nr:hypothetical protein [Saccharicrinis carchari]SMO65517.1 hypothetical protein SAMN06265379_104110 [Saccharicrinis carchari]